MAGDAAHSQQQQTDRDPEDVGADPAAVGRPGTSRRCASWKPSSASTQASTTSLRTCQLQRQAAWPAGWGGLHMMAVQVSRGRIPRPKPRAGWPRPSTRPGVGRWHPAEPRSRAGSPQGARRTGDRTRVTTLDASDEPERRAHPHPPTRRRPNPTPPRHPRHLSPPHRTQISRPSRRRCRPLKPRPPPTPPNPLQPGRDRADRKRRKRHSRSRSGPRPEAWPDRSEILR